MNRRWAPLLLFASGLAGCASVQPAPPSVAEQAPGLPLPPFPARAAPLRTGPLQVDFVLVDKSDRTLTLMADGRVVKTYSGIQLGGAPAGPKRFEGDERTPEGRYAIDYRNPESAYHLSLHISYPNVDQIADARSSGHSPGGAIFIHGQPNWMTSGRAPGDWTDGCIALSDTEIEELWSAIPDGTPIEIEP